MSSDTGESSGACWTATTNWLVAAGSLDDAVAYDTTDSDADSAAAAAAAGTALLIPPSSPDPPSCEITVTFKEKHDIHRVYIRSTARTYEIYYSTDGQIHSKEYLCTVRCSAAASDGKPDVSGCATAEFPKSFARIADIPDQPVQVESNNTDEDGWVQVKVPDSSVQHEANLVSKGHVGSTWSDFEIHYEATAEISDVCPSLTLTLRLLSLQTKTCVHIEEIYIYADPVGLISPDPPRDMDGNLGGSLLAMLAPGLLQMSKPGNSKFDGRSLLNLPGVQENQHGVGRTAETSRSNTGVMMLQEAYYNTEDLKAGLHQEPTNVQQQQQHESTQLRGSHKVTDPNQLPESTVDASNLAYIRVEKVLDELVSRVGRMEAFCSRFEENMMKPLGCIETRLQRIEQQLNTFSLKDHTSEPVTCSRVAAPESDPEKIHCFATCTSRNDTFIHGLSSPADMVASAGDSPVPPGLVVKAPGIINEDDKCISSSDLFDSAEVEPPKSSISISVEIASALVPESKKRPGLAVKAPEFVDEDDESVDSDDGLDSPVKDPSDGKMLSVDGAIASALKAFLTSTSIKSPYTSLTDAPREPDGGNDCSLVSSIVKTSPKAEHFREPLSLSEDLISPENLTNESDTENKSCGASELRSEHPVSGSSSLSTDDVTNTSLLVAAPEFPVVDHNFIVCDDESSVLPNKDCFEDQAPTALARFLSSKMAKSSNCYRTLLGDLLELSVDNKIELGSSSRFQENTARPNHGNNINGRVNLDLTLSSGDPESTLGQDDHFHIGSVCSSDDSREEKSIFNRGNLENSSQEKDGAVIQPLWSSNTTASDDELLTEDLLCRTGACGSTNSSSIGEGGTDDSDADEGALEARLNLRWIFGKTGSSLCGNISSEKYQADGSDETNISSDWGLSISNLTSGHAAEKGSNTETLVEDITNNNDKYTGAAGPRSHYGNERSIVEVQRALQSNYSDTVSELNSKGNEVSSGSVTSNNNEIRWFNRHLFDYVHESSLETEEGLADDYDTIMFNFGPVRNSRSKMSGKSLLGEMPIDTALGHNDGGMTDDEYAPTPSQSLDQKATAGHQLLQGVDDLTVPDLYVQQNPVRLEHQPFASLI